MAGRSEKRHNSRPAPATGRKKDAASDARKERWERLALGARAAKRRPGTRFPAPDAAYPRGNVEGERNRLQPAGPVRAAPPWTRPLLRAQPEMGTRKGTMPAGALGRSGGLQARWHAPTARGWVGRVPVRAGRPDVTGEPRPARRVRGMTPQPPVRWLRAGWQHVQAWPAAGFPGGEAPLRQAPPGRGKPIRGRRGYGLPRETGRGEDPRLREGSRPGRKPCA
jgi:hypothetical protein